MQLFGIAVGVAALELCVAEQHLHFVEEFRADTDPFAAAADGSAVWVKSSRPEYTHGNDAIHIKPVFEPMTGFENKRAMILTGEHMKYGVSARMPSAFDMGTDAAGAAGAAHKEFVVQYEVLHEEVLHCGGAYIKLLLPGSNLTDMHADTPYSVMFGPDRCGGTDKVHFILRYQSPVNGQYEEKHLVNAPRSQLGLGDTHLYTLVVRPDQTFTIYIDMEEARSGSLLTDMTPSIVPPATIADPDDTKPVDWVDNAESPDPHASKPEDWDEDQPATVEDSEDRMPTDWLEHEPFEVPFPKPDEWDDEEDGVFEASLGPNPACARMAGCGPWAPRRVHNPLYQGIWAAPLIDNPMFVGDWEPRHIPNPAHFLDDRPSEQIAFDALAIEVLTNQAGVVLDHFVVSDSAAAAFEYARGTFAVKQALEQGAERRVTEKRQLDDIYRRMESEDSGEWVLAWIDYVMILAQQNIMAALATLLALLAVPVVALTHLLTGPVVIEEGAPARGDGNGKDKDRSEEKEQEQEEVISPKRRSSRHG